MNLHGMNCREFDHKKPAIDCFGAAGMHSNDWSDFRANPFHGFRVNSDAFTRGESGIGVRVANRNFAKVTQRRLCNAISDLVTSLCAIGRNVLTLPGVPLNFGTAVKLESI
jgi:hypothetical protein